MHLVRQVYERFPLIIINDYSRLAIVGSRITVHYKNHQNFSFVEPLQHHHTSRILLGHNLILLQCLGSDSFEVSFSIFFLKVPTKFILFVNKLSARSTLEYQLPTYIVHHSLNKSLANLVTTASPTEHVGFFDLPQLIIVLYVRCKSRFGQKERGSLLCSKRGRSEYTLSVPPSHVSSYPFSSSAICPVYLFCRKVMTEPDKIHKRKQKTKRNL